MKIKTYKVPSDCTYLTENKIYECTAVDPYSGGIIIDDEGSELYISYGNNGCSHLDFLKWEIVNEKF